MASSWGPKVIGPEALVTHAGSDHAQTWLATHDDGTGPYELTPFARGRQYVLTRSPDYWGAQPYFKEVLIKITPDIGTQQLELQNGDVDAIMHSFPASELELPPVERPRRGVPVVPAPAALRQHEQAAVQQPGRPRVASRRRQHPPARRRGLLGHGDAVGRRVSRGDPPQPAGAPYAPNAKLAAAGAKAASTKNITLAYTADESGVQRRVGELIQADLAQAGWKVTVKEVQLPQVYGYINNLKAAPDLMLQTNTPDAVPPGHVGADPLRLDRRPELPRLQGPEGRQPAQPGAQRAGRPRRRRSTSRSARTSSTATRSSSSATSRTSSSSTRTSPASSRSPPTRGP